MPCYTCAIPAFNRYPMRIEKRGQTIENIDVITIKFVPDHIGLVLDNGGVIPEQFGHSELAFLMLEWTRLNERRSIAEINNTASRNVLLGSTAV